MASTYTTVTYRGNTYDVSGRIGCPDGAQDGIEISKEGKVSDQLYAKAEKALLKAQEAAGVPFYRCGRRVSY